MNNTITFQNVLLEKLDLKIVRKLFLVSEDGVKTSIRLRGRDKDHLVEMEEEVDKVTALVGKRVNVIVKSQEWRMGTRKGGTMYFLIDIEEFVS